MLRAGAGSAEGHTFAPLQGSARGRNHSRSRRGHATHELLAAGGAGAAGSRVAQMRACGDARARSPDAPACAAGTHFEVQRLTADPFGATFRMLFSPRGNPGQGRSKLNPPGSPPAG